MSKTENIHPHTKVCGFLFSNIINLFEFKKLLKRNIQSPADNYARHYAKRGLKRKRLGIGVPLNVIEITYSMIENMWKELKNSE